MGPHLAGQSIWGHFHFWHKNSMRLVSTRMHSSRMRTTRGGSRPQGGSASVHAGIHIHSPPPRCGPGDPLPWVWTWRPPWVFVWRPPRCGTGDPPVCLFGDPPGVGLETPLGVGLETSPPGDLLQGMLIYHPPCEQNHRHV